MIFGGINNRHFRLAYLLLSIAMVSLFFGHLVEAQNHRGWSRPQLIYETMEAIDTPYLVADTYGITHLIWRESERDKGSGDTTLEAIYYASDLGGNWSQGQDIIAMNSASGPTAAVDSDGLIHLVWQGPNNTLYHSLSNVESAQTAHGWAEPQAVAIANQDAHVVVDEGRSAHLVYPGVDSSGVYYIRYDTELDGWNAPTVVSSTSANNVIANYARLAIGSDGTLHVVWSEFLLPEAWPPTGVYYAQSKDNGNSWSRAVKLAGDNYDQITVAAGSGIVHVAWNGMVGVGGRYHRWSNDNGLTWSPTEAVVSPGKGGTEGLPQLQVDNAGVLHLLTTFDGCAWHASWENGNWSDPVCISGREAMASGWIEQPALTLSNGNLLHAVFWDDRARLWNATLMTGAPPTYEILPIMEAVPTATNAPAPPPTATTAATPLPASILTSDPPAANGMAESPAFSLILSAGAVFALLGLTLLIWSRRYR